MVDYASLLQIVVSILVWSGIAYAVNYNQNKSVNWLMLIAYEIVGVLVYFTGFTGGAAPDLPTFLTQMAGQVVVIGFVDSVLAQIYAALTQQSTLKSLIFPLDPHYTGHNFEPTFTLQLNDGTTRTFNTDATGICCSINVSEQLANSVDVKLANPAPKTAGWSPGFTVTPAFIYGVSPTTVALVIKAGFNSDNTPITTCTVNPQDGSPVDTVTLTLDPKTHTPTGIWQHTYTVAPE
jgi:hypothetical protein